jgi:hypothetical protein
MANRYPTLAKKNLTYMKRFIAWFKDDGWAATAVIVWFTLMAVVAHKLI